MKCDKSVMGGDKLLTYRTEACTVKFKLLSVLICADQHVRDILLQPQLQLFLIAFD